MPNINYLFLMGGGVCIATLPVLYVLWPPRLLASGDGSKALPLDILTVRMLVNVRSSH